MIRFRIITVLIMGLFLTATLYAQGWFYPTPKTLGRLGGSAFLKEGVQVVVGSFDDFTRLWGIDHDQLVDIGKISARAQGWQTNELAKSIILISITPLTNKSDDMHAFRIEARGSNPDLESDIENNGEMSSVILAMKTVDLKRNDDTFLYSVTSQLVTSVAIKLKKELMEVYSKRYDKENQAPSSGNEL